MVYVLLHNTLNKLCKNRLSHYIFLTKYANETKGFKPTTHKRLHPLKRLILYIYTKGLPETPAIQKAYSIYLNQRLTRDSIHSEGLFYISLPKAYRRTPPPPPGLFYISIPKAQKRPRVSNHSPIQIFISPIMKREYAHYLHIFFIFFINLTFVQYP